MRINKYLSLCGLGSRRFCDNLIKEKKIKINNIIVDDFSYKVLDEDIVTYNNKVIKKENKVYYIMNKPFGFVTTTKDKYAKKTVMDLIIDIKEKIYPVGRLDKDTTGLLLFTNDGDFADKILRPKNKVYKTYVAEVDKELNIEEEKKFKTGLKIDDYITREAILEKLKNKNGNFVYKVMIFEGKNRQIRKMFEYFNIKVLKLERIELLGIKIDSLKDKIIRKLSEDEINKIKKYIY